MLCWTVGHFNTNTIYKINRRQISDKRSTNKIKKDQKRERTDRYDRTDGYEKERQRDKREMNR